jgi:sugar O-acyltransferase (sialic acid O-acetyltransferase NeuD family)
MWRAVTGRSVVPLWILGSGGHAKVVIETVRKEGCHEISGILDGKLGRRDQLLRGIPILGEVHRDDIARHQVRQAVIAIGDNRARERIARDLNELVAWRSVSDPSALLNAENEPGDGTVVLAGVLVQPDSRIARHVILNTACTVDHDCAIGDFVHIGPGCQIGGGVEIGEGTQLGFGASVAPGCRIGKWSIIGAGSVVVDDIPDNSVAIGVPARLVKPLVPEVKKDKSRR